MHDDAALDLREEEPPEARDARRQLSVTDLFSIGVGPSSSHTVGPMKAAHHFAAQLAAHTSWRTGSSRPARSPSGDSRSSATAPSIDRIGVQLFGSLGATGRGHATDRAVVWGLAGHSPESIPMTAIRTLVDEVTRSGELRVAGQRVPFEIGRDVEFCPRTVLPQHVNALTFTAYCGGEPALARTYCSVGGGFVTMVDDDGATVALDDDAGRPSLPVSFPFSTGAGLLEACRRSDLGVAHIVRVNEHSRYTDDELTARLDAIWEAMDACIDAGLGAEGILPGGLNVPRRAGRLHAELFERGGAGQDPDPFETMDWVNLYALAVNEENAAGHRVVTAPTNGAAGVVPAVLKYYSDFVEGSSREGIHRFLLAATAIGTIIKMNASIAGAEVGCQGEVGSASAMAAAGLAEVMGGSPAQVENAAEIAMEHNLGLTCDPIGGLVQIPCIERNAVAAVKAINAARLAMWGDGSHRVSLDAVVETMRQTGQDMMSKYKETSLGGLAVNVVEC